MARTIGESSTREVNRGYKTEEFINPFGANPDGAHPIAPLTLLDSVFYGTTEAGGDNDKGCVYKINADGSQHVVYSFKGGSGDGAVPNAGLTVLNGVLYGVTSEGGTNDDGTVFDLATNGSEEKVSHSFNGTNGRHPRASLAVLNGKFYGTTDGGGSADDGTVFEVQTDGTFRQLHSFEGRDGNKPLGALTVFGSGLFGTTLMGGANNDGTVFELVP